MASDAEVRAWSDGARRYAFSAVRRYLIERGTPDGAAQDRADEAAQEGLSRVLDRYEAERFETSAHFCRTVARAAINWATSEFGRRKSAVSVDKIDVSDPGAEPEKKWTDDCMERFRRAFGSVPPADQKLLQLKYVKGWTLAEIAEELDTTVDWVWRRLNRLLGGLRRELERGA